MSKVFSFAKNAPPPIDERDYERRVMDDYRKLLKEKCNDEKAFQEFFEKNPSLVPGAKSNFIENPSGHGPINLALISQPKISGLNDKHPDFMWLSWDSSAFCPVFIEIETPGKKYFNKNKTPNAKFTQALNQLKNWQTILEQSANRLKFYNDYCIGQDLRDSHFEPYFVLIYGRREELEKGNNLALERKKWENRNETIMSFDRIVPQFVHKNFITCKVKGGRYVAKCLTPTFKIGPHSDGSLCKLENLGNAVDSMSYTTNERKKFLKERIPYWLECLKLDDNVSIKSNDWQFDE